MYVKKLLQVFRAVVLLVFAWALCGYSVRWAEENPYGGVQKVLLAIAEGPHFIAETFLNVFSPAFRESLTPDEFGSKHTYQPVINHTSHRIEGLVMRRGTSARSPLAGWRMLYGIFQIDGSPQYAVMALSPRLTIERIWIVTKDMLTADHFAISQAPYPHGFALLHDGSMVLGFDNIYRPLRMDACGKPIVSGDTRITHAINPTDGDRFAWGVSADSVIKKFDLKTGKTVRSITMQDLRAANPQISVFAMRRVDDNALGKNPRDDDPAYYKDPFHANDVEPLPAALAPRFPAFAAGDLLISLRSLNAVMVVDPTTLHVKWLTNDYTLRQHDPDWEADGEISVLDNQNGRHFSRIVRFNPTTGTHRVSVDGAKYDFYTRIRGKHQTLPNGGVLITSSEQGRIFELDASGKLSFEMLVHDPERPGRNFVVSEAAYFPTASPAIKEALSCSGS